MQKRSVSISYSQHNRTQWENVALIWFLGGFFVLPLIVWPPFFEPFELPKVWFFSRWIEILWLIAFVGRLRSHLGYRRLLLAVAVFVVAVTGLALVGVDPLKSLVGNYYRHDGLVTLYHLVALSAWVGLFWRETWDHWFYQAGVWSFGVLAAGVVGEALRKGVGVALVSGNENFLAGTLVFGLPLLVGMRESPDKNANLALIALILLHLALLLTGSWGGLVGIAVFWLGWALLRRHTGVVLLGIVVGLGAIGGYAVEVQQRGWSGEGRERVLTKVYTGALGRFMTGMGWANADYAFEAGKTAFEPGIEPYVDKAHGEFLEVFATTGLGGLALYLGVWGIALRRLWYWGRDGFSGREAVVALGLLVYGVHSQVNVVSITEQAWFYLFLGWLMAPSPGLLARGIKNQA